MEACSRSIIILFGFWLTEFGDASRTTAIHVGNWCNVENIKIGDYNGNGLHDMMCYSGDGWHKIIFDSSSRQTFSKQACFDQVEEQAFRNLSTEVGFCKGTHLNRHIADFNGDGKDDLNCYNRYAGDHRIVFADAQGFLNGAISYFNKWCYGGVTQLYVGDFNGDRQADLLCHDPGDGRLWVNIRKIDNFYAGSDWYRTMTWCTDGGTFLVGDFNGDQADDILCSHPSGRIEISYAIISGSTFQEFNQTYYSNVRFCDQPGSDLRVGYLNHDRLADLICRNSSGITRLAINNGNTRFNVQATRGLVFCSGDDENFFVGHFTARDTQQLLCVQHQQWQILSDFIDY